MGEKPNMKEKKIKIRRWHREVGLRTNLRWNIAFFIISRDGNKLIKHWDS